MSLDPEDAPPGTWGDDNDGKNNERASKNRTAKKSVSLPTVSNKRKSGKSQTKNAAPTLAKAISQNLYADTEKWMKKNPNIWGGDFDPEKVKKVEKLAAEEKREKKRNQARDSWDILNSLYKATVSHTQILKSIDKNLKMDVGAKETAKSMTSHGKILKTIKVVLKTYVEKIYENTKALKIDTKKMVLRLDKILKETVKTNSSGQAKTLVSVLKSSGAMVTSGSGGPMSHNIRLAFSELIRIGYTQTVLLKRLIRLNSVKDPLVETENLRESERKKTTAMDKFIAGLNAFFYKERHISRGSPTGGLLSGFLSSAINLMIPAFTGLAKLVEKFGKYILMSLLPSLAKKLYGGVTLLLETLAEKGFMGAGAAARAAKSKSVVPPIPTSVGSPNTSAGLPKASGTGETTVTGPGLPTPKGETYSPSAPKPVVPTSSSRFGGIGSIFKNLKGLISKSLPSILKKMAASSIFASAIQSIFTGLDIYNLKGSDLPIVEKKKQIGRALMKFFPQVMGTVGGGVIGSLIPGAGTLAGGFLGGILGNYAGDWAGGYISELVEKNYGPESLFNVFSSIPGLSSLIGVEENDEEKGYTHAKTFKASNDSGVPWMLSGASYQDYKDKLGQPLNQFKPSDYQDYKDKLGQPLNQFKPSDSSSKIGPVYNSTSDKKMVQTGIIENAKLKMNVDKAGANFVNAPTSNVNVQQQETVLTAPSYNRRIDPEINRVSARRS